MSNNRKKSSLRGLVISCKEGEQISFSNGEVLMEFVEVRKNQVRIAFQANKDIRIERIPISLAEVQNEDDSIGNT
jgi:sRNA-binding carbon storage regulator CsrA